MIRKPSDTSTSYQLLHRTIWQHLSIMLFLLLSIGVGLGTARAQAQTRAYVTNAEDSTVSVIDTATKHPWLRRQTNNCQSTHNFPQKSK